MKKKNFGKYFCLVFQTKIGLTYVYCVYAKCNSYAISTLSQKLLIWKLALHGNYYFLLFLKNFFSSLIKLNPCCNDQ